MKRRLQALLLIFILSPVPITLFRSAKTVWKVILWREEACLPALRKVGKMRESFGKILPKVSVRQIT
jgi:hypothetical protein